MTLNGNLWNAILAMDSYNRGYGAGMTTPELSDAAGTKIGNYAVLSTSTILGPNVDQSAGFYAVAYDSNNDGKADIISYRGTDQPPHAEQAIGFFDLALLFSFPGFGVTNIAVKLADNIINSITPDTWNGWFVGMGVETSAQALLAFEFYKDVVGGFDNVYSSNVSLTGHSLGGGLAGLVAGVYGKTATVFDQMPFEKALQDTYNASVDPNSSEYDETLKSIVYGNGSINHYNPNLLDTSFSIEGEALSEIRNNALFGLVTTSTLSEHALDLGSTLQADQLTDAQRHSQALLVIRMFFAQEDILPQPGLWDKAAKYFWPVMYDKDFAGSIEFNNSTTLAGRDHDSGDYASIMRQALAYSIIDEGTKVFGDTGIRAFYDDANDFGKILTTNLPDTVPSMIVGDFGKEISEVFIQYAAQLALNRVELANVTNTVLKGVLSSENFGILTLDLSDTTWSVAGGGTPPPIVGKEKIITKIMNGIEELHTLDGDAGGLVGVNDNNHRKWRENDYRRLCWA